MRGTLLSICAALVAAYPAMAQNHSPVAVVGPDQTVMEGQMVILDASRSYDPDGDPIWFFWNQIGGPMVDLDFSDPSRVWFSRHSRRLGKFRS